MRWILPLTFFEWLCNPKLEDIERSKRNLEENIFTLMELMGVGYNDILIMPYSTLISALKWKVEIENEKKKKIEENNRERSKKHRNRPLRKK